MRRSHIASLAFLAFGISTCKARMASQVAIAATSETVSIQLTPESCDTHGRVLATGDLPTPEDLAKDAYCVDMIMRQYAPRGAITVFGSARPKADHPNYLATVAFAKAWAEGSQASTYPILTGGGPGIMEAANHGAKEGGATSLGLGTYFGAGNSPEQSLNGFLTKGFLCASFSQREAEMVDRAAAIVIAPGGLGTEWEVFESLSKVQTKKIRKVPIVMIGGQDDDWATLVQRIERMRAANTISDGDEKLMVIIKDPVKAARYIEACLGDGQCPAPPN